MPLEDKGLEHDAEEEKQEDKLTPGWEDDPAPDPTPDAEIEEDTSTSKDDDDDTDGSKDDGGKKADDAADDTLTTRAVEELGIAKETAAALAESGHLQELLDAADQKLKPTPPATPAAKGDEATTADDKGAEGDQGKKDALTLKDDLEAQGYDLEDPMVKILLAQDAKNGELSKRLDGMLTSQKEEAQVAHERAFDSAISALPESWEELFGKGSVDALDPDGAEMRHRQKLDDAMILIQSHRADKDLAPLDAAEVMDRALRLEYADTYSELDQAALSGKLKGQRRRMAARPTGRGADKPGGVNAAIAKSEAFDKQHGVG